MALVNHPIIRISFFTLSSIILISYFLYSSETYAKLSLPSNIIQLNVENRSLVNIPRNIIQTAKNQHSIERLAQSFKHLNPNHSYIFFNDTQAAQFVRQHMPPHIIHAYEIMPIPVLKADYFRYISTYILGGVYTDSDTECLRPIDTWTDNHTNVAFIVAIEAESPLWKIHYARPLQLCQWTFASAPKHPILKRMIDNIAIQTRKFAGGTLSISAVMDWTGPGLWTDTIFDYINETYHLEWATLSKLQHSRLIGDICFLPIPAFDPKAYHMGAKGRSDPEARVDHHFHGSWKKNYTTTTPKSTSIPTNITNYRTSSKL